MPARRALFLTRNCHPAWLLNAFPSLARLWSTSRGKPGYSIVSVSSQIMRNDAQYMHTYGVSLSEFLDPLWGSFADLTQQFPSELIAQRYEPPLDGQTRECSWLTSLESIVFDQSTIGLRTVESLYENRNNDITGRIPRVCLVDEVNFTYTEGRQLNWFSPCLEECLTRWAWRRK